MDIIRFAIQNPVKVIVVVIFVLLGGGKAITSIPVQMVPTIDRPVISVRTYWPGASPREIEREIVERQEEQLKRVADLYKMTSESEDSRAEVTLQFNVGVDKESALREVSEKLGLVRDYPDGVQERIIRASDSSSRERIAWLHIHADDGRDISELRDWIEDHVEPRIKRVKGVATVDVYGGREREVQVVVDPVELAARGLTFRDLEVALRQHNTNISAGTISAGKLDFTYRTIGQYETLSDVEGTIIASSSGGPVFVRDVATVRDSFRKQYSFIRSLGSNGKGAYAISLPVTRESGSNVIDIINGSGPRKVLKTQSGQVFIQRDRKGVKDVIEEINANLLEPRGLHMKMSYDESVYIVAALELVRDNILVGAALSIVVLLLFLRSISGTLVVAVAIPISAVGTFLGVYALGRSLNVIMLAGMTFAIGMVVDNAIVVLENIYRHREMGKNRFDASLDGAREVWGAVLASTLTTMAVFVPVIFVQEEAGQLFRDIAIAISVGVGLSLIVAITVIPTLSAKILQPTREPKDGRGGRIANAIAGAVHRLNGSVALRLTVVVVLTTVSILASYALMPPATYMPSGNRNFVFGRLLAPPGYTLDQFREFAAIIEKELEPYWNAELGSPEEADLREAWAVKVRDELAPAIRDNPTLSDRQKDQQIRDITAPPPPIASFFMGSFYGSGFIGISAKNPDAPRPMVNLINSIAPKLPGAFLTASQSSLFGRGSGNSIEVELRGDNLSQVTEAAKAVFALALEKFGKPPSPEPRNFDQGRPEVRIVPDPEKAADLNLSVRDVGFIVEACVDGALVGEYRDQSDTVDLVIKVDDAYAQGTERVLQVPIVSPTGRMIPLASVVSVYHTTSPQAIHHIEEQPAVSLRISAPEGVALEETMNVIEEEIVAPLRAQGKIHENVYHALAGNADKLTRTFDAIKGNLLWAVVITYFLLAALFESFTYPFVVMFSVPLAAVGGFAGLALVHYQSKLDPVQPVQQLDILTMLGFVLLIGVVVNNAILIVHQTRNNILHAGLDPREAIRESVRSRIRPIFMSTTTTVIGMLPLVLRFGAGSELYRGLGSVMVGGLIVSTIFTIVLVPTLLSLMLDAQAAILRLAGRPQLQPAPARGAVSTGRKRD